MVAAASTSSGGTAGPEAPGPDLPERGPDGEVSGYDRSREVQLDDLNTFADIYAEALLHAEQTYQGTDLFWEDDEDAPWEIMGIGAGTPLRVKDEVGMDTVYDLVRRNVEENVSPSTVEQLEEAVVENPRSTLKTVGGAGGAVTGTYLTLQNGNVGALEPLEPFASEIAVAAGGASLDGSWEMAKELRSDAYEELRDCALDHFYIVDVEYHKRDLGEIDRLVDEYGVDYLEDEGIMSAGQYEMLKKWPEDGAPVRLLFAVWDPTDDRIMVQHVLDEYFEDYGDPQAVYNRNLC
ncbi:MAG: hypothetical protein SVW02_00395 [Candidatus Nanohaloarchaea archaeon]|nr:hypothetical protein [Candidatus Nanohaloarchaea archaeon]